ncbi:hypothetical protein BBD41_14935 [Paenibacillus ihbetae]|uniref:Uncharacterized protein n=1 Tax=Paenibacillus ihbetae TaxID=1870820 RepID=A0A1B2E189_9BACL|nr:hypothetical protein BBD41_14935 [Paenibacillus ihbetae]OOC64049.1 hypothetical protein BBD40_20595 [Paenibacillus ihbetae]
MGVLGRVAACTGEIPLNTMSIAIKHIRLLCKLFFTFDFSFKFCHLFLIWYSGKFLGQFLNSF